MALITCPECNKKISDTTDSCMNCGYKLTPEKVDEIKKKGRQVKKGCGIGCLAVIVIFAILIMIGYLSSDSKKTRTITPTSSETPISHSRDSQNSEARQFVSTIKGGLDDDMEHIFSQISINHSNSWRNGEKRYFEYNFGDGSSLILVAVPKESGGLKLYMIDIADTPGSKRWKSP